MNAITNIWKHPKTTASGVLLAAVTVSSVLAQQGIGLGQVGSGSVVTLVVSIGTALLGLLARDPNGKSSASKSTSTLNAWLLIALLFPMPWVTGCSSVSVAQQIVNWTPALESAVATVNSAAAVLAPADVRDFLAASTGFDTAANLLETQAKAYLANPSAGTLAALQNQITVFSQQVNTTVLQAGKITNPASKQRALMAVQAVATVTNAILALVQSVSSKTDVARMADESPIKLAQVLPLLDEKKAAALVAAQYDEPVRAAQEQIAETERVEVTAGF